MKIPPFLEAEGRGRAPPLRALCYLGRATLASDSEPTGLGT